MSHGVSSKKFIELAGAAGGIILASGKLLVANLLPKTDTRKNALLTFVRDYKKRYKVDGDHFGGHPVDAVMLLKSAIDH